MLSPYTNGSKEEFDELAPSACFCQYQAILEVFVGNDHSGCRGVSVVIRATGPEEKRRGPMQEQSRLIALEGGR